MKSDIHPPLKINFCLSTGTPEASWIALKRCLHVRFPSVSFSGSATLTWSLLTPTKIEYFVFKKIKNKLKQQILIKGSKAFVQALQSDQCFSNSFLKIISFFIHQTKNISLTYYYKKYLAVFLHIWLCIVWLQTLNH